MQIYLSRDFVLTLFYFALLELIKECRAVENNKKIPRNYIRCK